MTALEGQTRATLETWLGPIASGDEFGQENDLLKRLGRLALPELVALEILMADQSSFTRNSTKIASDDVRSDHGVNIGANQGRIDQLVSAIRADDTLNLSTDQERLVASAEVATVSTTTIEVAASARRRG